MFVSSISSARRSTWRSSHSPSFHLNLTSSITRRCRHFMYVPLYFCMCHLIFHYSVVKLICLSISVATTIQKGHILVIHPWGREHGPSQKQVFTGNVDRPRSVSRAPMLTCHVEKRCRAIGHQCRIMVLRALKHETESDCGPLVGVAVILFRKI